MKGRKVKLVKDTAKALLPFQDHLRRLRRQRFPYQPNLGNSNFALTQGLIQVLC